MTKRTGLWAALPALVLTVALPHGALAQFGSGGGGGGGAPAQPQHRAAPARPSPPPAARAPSFHAPVVRSAPQPHVAPRVTPTVRAPQPHFNVQRREAIAPRHAPSVDRTVREQRRHERVQRQVQQPSAQPRILSTRQFQRQERTLRRQESRELRRLPSAQRTVKREEFRRARELRAQQRLHPQTLPTVGAKPSTPTTATRSLRRSGQPRIAGNVARQGRFAAPFAARASARSGSGRHWRGEHDAARRAWRHGRRAAFVAWYGPVFWPYVYSDIFDYTFWPYGYDDGYWAYAYDDFFDSIFWGEEGPPEEYGYALAEGAPAPRRPSTPRYAAVQELCKQPGSGITAWPFADIEKKVSLNGEQKELLADMKKAGEDAAAVFKASCPSDEAFPLTPPGRLQAMTLRLQATLQAVQTVRPALDKFYDSLSDEQKERFNEIGPKQLSASAEASPAQDVKSCKEPKQGLSNLPIEKIEDVVKPTDAQADKLKALEDATTKGVTILQAACPEDTPVTPPGRLEVMEKRLQAMIDAANTVKPALADFYGSLNSEQKARFNRIGRSLAQAEQ